MKTGGNLKNFFDMWHEIPKFFSITAFIERQNYKEGSETILFSWSALVTLRFNSKAKETEISICTNIIKRVMVVSAIHASF